MLPWRGATRGNWRRSRIVQGRMVSDPPPAMKTLYRELERRMVLHFIAFVIIYFDWSTWCRGRRKKDMRIKFFWKVQSIYFEWSISCRGRYKKDIVLFRLLCFLHACMTIHLWLNNRRATFRLDYIDCRELVEKLLGFCDHLLSGALAIGERDRKTWELKQSEYLFWVDNRIWKNIS